MIHKLHQDRSIVTREDFASEQVLDVIFKIGFSRRTEHNNIEKRRGEGK